MTLAALRMALREALAAEAAGTDAAHDLSHSDRVWTHARTIAHGEGMAPSRVLLCAAYLHDLVTLPKDHPKRAKASMLSASAAGPVMQALGLSPSEIAQARHAIEAHSYSGGGQPTSPEARIGWRPWARWVWHGPSRLPARSVGRSSTPTIPSPPRGRSTTRPGRSTISR
jgi:uncharacterized protein